MSDRPRMIGYNRTVKLRWLDETVDLFLAGMSDADIYEALRERLKDELSVGSTGSTRQSRENDHAPDEDLGPRAAAVARVAERRRSSPARNAPLRTAAAALGYDDGSLSVLAGSSGCDRPAVPAPGNCGSDAGSEARQGVAR